MRRFVLAALAALLLAGCGGTRTITRGVPSKAIEVAPCVTLGPPCSAITPEGARGADKTRLVEGKPPPTLIGGEIVLDTFGAELTGGFENVPMAVYCPYWDPYGHVWSRGYGETDWAGNFGGRCISKAEALRNLIYLMDTRYLAPVRALDENFSHDQVDALGDLSWNVGPGVICCELASLLRAHRWAEAGVYILRYSYAGGVYLSALHARRERERALLQVLEPACSINTPAPCSTTQLLKWQTELRYLLARDGCRARIARHQKLGPKCATWVAQGNRLDAVLGRRK